MQHHGLETSKTFVNRPEVRAEFDRELPMAISQCLPCQTCENLENFAGFKWGTLPFKCSGTYTATHWEPPGSLSIDHNYELNSTVNSSWPYLHAFLVQHAKISKISPASSWERSHLNVPHIQQHIGNRRVLCQ
jgi:hypothetical protein